MKSKGLSFIWCALALLFSTPAIAQDRITATLLPTQVNGEWTLELNLENPNESRYTALQLDINLPVGFSIADNTATTSTRLPDHSLVVSNTTGNTYRVAAYSLTNTAFEGNSGCIASMTLRAHESAEEGAYYASLNNIIVSTRAGEEVDFNDYSFSWTYEKISSFYTITYWVDGEVFATQNYQEGASISLSDTPEKVGHTFVGWKDLPESMPGEDINVEALFTVNSYVLTFIVDGVVVKQESVAYGTAITAPEVEDKEGHTFSGWSAYPETMPATDVEVTATYTVNTYKITYILDGEVYAEDSVAYGAVITPVQIEEDETFTFSGWSNLPEVMPAHDIVVTGTTTLTALSALHATETRIDVYTLSGKLVARKVSPAWIKTGLTKGVYIINGKKVMIQ